MVQGWIPKYRDGFHAGLRDALDERGIDLTLIYGPPVGEAAAKDATLEIPWAHRVDHRLLTIGSRRLMWQPCMTLVRGADLIICDQASSRLNNYVFLARHLMGRERFALWGHGRNFQAARASTAGEAAKRWMSRRPHWWFAYNELSAAVVVDLGFPADRITDVQNTIDTGALIEAKDASTAESLAALRQRLGIRGDHVGVYVGGMYAEKRLVYLLESLDLVRAQVPDFEAIFVGTGPDADLVTAAARRHDWIHHVGQQFDEGKAHHLLLGQVLLMPGLVGLAVIDSFALGVPMVTVADSQHSPEIAYLDDGENGVMAPAGSTPREYASAVTRVLTDPAVSRRLVAGCSRAAERYTMEEMVRRFADGTALALQVASERSRR
jgi:glycosyltransferase involved in cell wall biosynthesis